MNLIRLCLDRPVGVSVGVLLVTLFGLLSLFAIPVQLTPNVDVPVVNIETVWPGSNPQEVEREIIDRQEEMLRSVKGLRKMTSSARDSVGHVSLEFYPNTDKNEALRDVNDKLRQVSGYPLEVEEPTVSVGDAEMDTVIAWLILYAEEDSEEIRKLRDFAEDYIQPYLDRVRGVASTDIYGGLEREVQVRVDAGKLAARGLTFRQLEEALRRQNQNVSAGTRTQGKRDYALRTVGQYESLDEVLETVVAYTPGGPVYVRDVAEAELAYKDPEGLVRSKGQYVLAFPVRREVGANVMDVMAELRVAIQRVNDEVLKARKMNLELVQVYDETVYIGQSIDMVRDNIVYGSALVLGLLLAFLRSWRATAVLALSIPVSVIGTFLVIVLLGRTLNVISLAGIAFAVGDVVDSAYVVLENVFRHKQLGKPIRQAVLDGTREVWGAVLASTLTTMAVFLPVIFVQEEAGQLFRDISVAEVVAVGLSMVVAITVIPPLAARLLKHDHTVAGFQSDPAPTVNAHRAKAHPFDPALWLASLLAGLVARINKGVVSRAVVIVGLSVGSLWAASWLIPETTYLPAGNRNLVFGFLLTPPGYSVDEFRRMGHEVEKVIAPYWAAKEGSPEQRALDEAWVKQVEAMLSSGAIPELANPQLGALERSRIRREWLTPPPLIDNFFFVTWRGGCFMGATSRDPARVKPLVRLLQTAGQSIPGTFAFFQQAQIFSFGGGNNAEVQIRGDDLDKVVAAAEAMQMACMAKFGFVMSDPRNYNLGRPEIRVTPDRERAADLGMTVRDIGFIVEACGDGAYVGDYRVAGGDTVDLTLYVRGQESLPTQRVGEVPIFTPTGRLVPLSAVARLTDTTALEQINHIERQRAVSLTVDPGEIPLAAVMRAIREEEKRLREANAIDPSITIALTGNADKLVAARNSLVGEWKGWTWETLRNLAGGKFFLSVIIVYLLMCALYESWIYPFVIMFSVPLAVLGGFLGLSVCHWGTLLTTHQPVQQLDVLTFLGFIMLVGLVVKNAILLVEQALVFVREHHMPPHDAVRESVHVRVRPVLMTTLTSIVGLLPLALMPGAGSELYRGLASVILGGMFVSTMGTFVLVPAVLSAVFDVQYALGRRPAAVHAVPEAEVPPEAQPAPAAGGGD